MVNITVRQYYKVVYMVSFEDLTKVITFILFHCIVFFFALDINPHYN